MFSQEIWASLALYWKRLAHHRALVWKYGVEWGLADTRWGRIRLFFHDWDKYLPRRYYYYARYFHDVHSDIQVVEGFRQESDRHVQGNRHHWQLWADTKQAAHSIHCTAMPLRDMLEMVADWRAMSEEKGTSCVAWYKAQKLAGKLYLHPITAIRVSTLLTTPDPQSYIAKWKSEENVL